jgi:hypothetical protein
MADDRRFQEKVFQHEPALSGLQWGTAAKARKFAINSDIFSLNVHNLIECATTCAIKPRCRPHTELLEHISAVSYCHLRGNHNCQNGIGDNE